MHKFFTIYIVPTIIKGFELDYRELNFTCNMENLPCLDQSEWWGPQETKGHQDTRVKPFKIHFDDEMIEDLLSRLDCHRTFTPPLKGTTFDYGFNSKELLKWIQYWSKEYPFKRREAFLNKYPMFKTDIQGLDIFFIWNRPQIPTNKEVVPLLLLHGWPGSVREFYEAIPLLSAEDRTRDFTLELIIPALPGFSYSDAAVRPGLGAAQTAVIFHNLMKRLGYHKYYIQGGDFGGLVCSYMATMYPKVVLGFHTNWPAILHPTARIMHVLAALYPPLIVDPKLANRLYPLYTFGFSALLESGYFHEQATKPDSIGVCLIDSPSGLLAYNLEKFNTFLGTRGSNNLDRLPRVNLIDNLMMYWASGSVTTALRLYAETFNRKHFGLGLDVIPSKVLVWSIQAANELTYDPPALQKVKHPFLVNTTAVDFGGHFLAFESPEVFSNDVLKAIGEFRRLRSKQEELTEFDLQPDYQWRLSLADFLQAVSNVQNHPDAWWVRAVLKFTLEAILRLAKLVFSYNAMSILVSQMMR